VAIVLRIPAASRQGEREESARAADSAPTSLLTRDAAPLPSSTPAASPRIWAVGGGKGGVGKSIVSSSVAAAIAGTGRRCAVIDADLGGANLHTLLGVARPRRTLSHLLTGEVSSLADLMVQTSVRNLWLVSGNQALLEMANPKPKQKELLIGHIHELDVDDVLLDLGAGSAFNVLDFFLLARRGLVVVTPEPTAIENAEHFLRAAFYRSLREVTRRPDVRAAIRRLREDGDRQVRSARELIALVRAIDPPAAKPLEDTAQAFTPLLLVNQVQTAEHLRVGPELVTACRDRLGVAIELAGSIESDPNVPAAVLRRQPVLQAFPRSRFAQRIELLVRRLLRDEAEPVRAHVGAPESARSGASTPRAALLAPPRPALPPLDLDQPGAYLRRCRETLGLTVSEMVERTRIRILDHIESERFDLLPPEPYLKGYLLEYARELGVVEFAVLAASYVKRCREGRSPR